MNTIPTVLIVEDEFAIAELLEMVLVDEGYRVLTASNGLQGLARLAEVPRPDLIISDFMMPGLDGPGLIAAVRERVGEPEIPCIVMSSMPEENVRELIQGYAAFVRKPFLLAAVVALVGSLIGPAVNGSTG